MTETQEPQYGRERSAHADVVTVGDYRDGDGRIHTVGYRAAPGGKEWEVLDQVHGQSTAVVETIRAAEGHGDNRPSHVRSVAVDYIEQVRAYHSGLCEYHPLPRAQRIDLDNSAHPKPARPKEPSSSCRAGTQLVARSACQRAA